MSVLYKFKNTIKYEPVKFDGLHIPVSDLKNIIIQQKKLGDSELQIQNEETNHIYTDDQQIPKNTNLLIVRIPLANPHKKPRLASHTSNGTSNGHKTNHNHNNNNNSHSNNNPSQTTQSSQSYTKEALEIVTCGTKKLSEQEKLKQIQQQSTQDFTHVNSRSSYRHSTARNNLHNRPPASYVCRKCGIPGHFIQDCKGGAARVKPASGIPKAFMRTADPKDKGALLTANGEYAVPLIDAEAYENPKVEKAPFFEEEYQDSTTDNLKIHDQLKCRICHDILKDAVVTSGCCKIVFCDNCIRTSLIESETHECPSCFKQEVSPDSLKPSNFYRMAVNSCEIDPMDLFMQQLKSGGIL